MRSLGLFDSTDPGSVYIYIYIYTISVIHSLAYMFVNPPVFTYRSVHIGTFTIWVKKFLTLFYNEFLSCWLNKFYHYPLFPLIIPVYYKKISLPPSTRIKRRRRGEWTGREA